VILSNVHFWTAKLFFGGSRELMEQFSFVLARTVASAPMPAREVISAREIDPAARDAADDRRRPIVRP
jgi:hypothetical protein